MRRKICFVMTVLLSLSLGAVTVASANKQDEWRKVKRLQKTLRDRAEIFNEAYVAQDFKAMYKLVEPSYRKTVSLKEYQDYVFYFNTTNGYMKAEILDVIIMPNRMYGKVLKKRGIYDKGENKPIREFIYGEDWIVVDNIWYRMESKN